MSNCGLAGQGPLVSSSMATFRPPDRKLYIQQDLGTYILPIGLFILYFHKEHWWPDRISIPRFPTWEVGVLATRRPGHINSILLGVRQKRGLLSLLDRQCCIEALRSADRTFVLQRNFCFSLVTPPGFEPGTPPWKGGDLDCLSTGPYNQSGDISQSFSVTD